MQLCRNRGQVRSGTQPTSWFVFWGDKLPLNWDFCGLDLKFSSINCAVSPHSLRQRYPSVFDGVGKLTNYQQKISINTTIKPVAQPPRRIPFHVRKQVSAKLEELERLDIIETVRGPTPWVSPLVVVPKSSGEIRVCVDMRQVNTAVIRERYPIPTVEESLQDLNGAAVFFEIRPEVGLSSN